MISICCTRALSSIVTNRNRPKVVSTISRRHLEIKREKKWFSKLYSVFALTFEQYQKDDLKAYRTETDVLKKLNENFTEGIT